MLKYSEVENAVFFIMSHMGLNKSDVLLKLFYASVDKFSVRFDNLLVDVDSGRFRYAYAG